MGANSNALTNKMTNIVSENTYITVLTNETNNQNLQPYLKFNLIISSFQENVVSQWIELEPNHG
jgi:hypothetical protein